MKSGGGFWAYHASPSREQAPVIRRQFCRKGITPLPKGERKTWYHLEIMGHAPYHRARRNRGGATYRVNLFFAQVIDSTSVDKMANRLLASIFG
jgi:hypothetical protein